MIQKIRKLNKFFVPTILLVVVSLLIAIIYQPQLKTILFSCVTIIFCFVPFLLTIEQNLGTFLFLFSFSGIYEIFWFRKILTLFLFAFSIKYVISIIKKQKKLLILPLILSLIIAGYCFINFNFNNISKLLDYLILLSVLYLTIVYFKEIDKTKLLRYFIYGIFCSSILAWIIHLLPFEQSFVFLTNSTRFQALTRQTNTLQAMCGISLACTLTLFLNKKISVVEFLCFSLPLIFIGLTTKSKAFLIILSLLVLIYLVAMFIKNKKVFCFSLIAIIVLALIFKDKVWLIIERFKQGNLTNFWDSIFSGRCSIWKNYLEACTSSVSKILFGFGSSAKDLGIGAHNMLIEFWFRFGLVGIALFVALVILYVLHVNKTYGKNKNILWFLPLIVFLLIGIEEAMLPILSLVFILCVIFTKNEENLQKEKEKNMIKEKFKFLKAKDIFSFVLLFIVLLPALITKIFIRDFWLVCEDENEARDNGYWFFKYVREKHQKQKIAYAINKKSVDYPKVKSLGKVIKFGGLAHWFWYIVADKNISSQKNGKPNAAVCYLFEVVFKMRKKNRFFLQHGVIINDLEFLHFKNTNMYRFSVSTHQENEFVKSKFGYPEGAICLTGLCRFDGLFDAVADKNQILVMPTWRQWIAKGVETEQIEGSSVFTETNYFKTWQSFVNNEELDKLLTKYNKKLIFYPHRNMQKYINEFKTNSKNIIIANSKEYDVQTLLKTSGFLITDYSSVFFDFAYMKKPIIFYQFDEKQFRKHQYEEGYFNYKNNDLSSWCENEKDLCDILEKYLINNLEKENPEKVDAYFAYRDNKNCERNYLMIKGKKSL